MQLIKTLASLAIIALLAFGTARLVHSLAPQPAPPPPAPVPGNADGSIAILLGQSLEDSHGRPQPLSQWEGRPLLVNFWASWCAPCLEEMPLLDSLARDQATDGLQVLGIAIDREDNIRRFAHDHPVHYPLLIANGAVQDILPALGNASRGIPFSVLVDAQGHVRHIRLGALHPAELKKWLLTVKPHSVPNGVNKK